MCWIKHIKALISLNIFSPLLDPLLFCYFWREISTYLYLLCSGNISVLLQLFPHYRHECGHTRYHKWGKCRKRNWVPPQLKHQCTVQSDCPKAKTLDDDDDEEEELWSIASHWTYCLCFLLSSPTGSYEIRTRTLPSLCYFCSGCQRLFPLLGVFS